MNKGTAADIVLLEAIGDFVGNVQRLINKVSNDCLFELVVRSLGKKIHLAGGTIGIEREALKNLELQELSTFSAPSQTTLLIRHRDHEFLHAAKERSSGYAADEEFQKLCQYCYWYLDHIILKYFGRLTEIINSV